MTDAVLIPIPAGLAAIVDRVVSGTEINRAAYVRLAVCEKLQRKPKLLRIPAPRTIKSLERRVASGSSERFKGIVRDAESLGVTRVHLWKVLTGRRSGAALLGRYQALRAEAAK